MASEEIGQEGGSQDTGCGVQGGNEGARLWVGLDGNMCRAPFVLLSQAL